MVSITGGGGWLERGYASTKSGLTTLKVGPMWDPIRADPRFVALARRVGL
jgi:hypothetical protein